MPASLDLTLLPLIRTAGQDQPDMAGILIAEPPRRAARSRSGDHLILYLALVGNAPLSPGKQEDVLAQLARTYFDTPGSVTAALRAAAESLNAFLLDRNLHSSNTGRQSIGWLTLASLRQNQLYLAQSGPVHAFLVTAEGIQHLHDPQVAGRGLGLSRTTSVRFFHSLLAPDDTLLLAAQPAPSWTAAGLAGTHGQGPESLRRRLFNRSVPDIHAVLIQAKAGRGRIFQYQPPAAAPVADATPTAAGPVLSGPPPAPAAVQPLPEAAVPAEPPDLPGAAVFEAGPAEAAVESTQTPTGAPSQPAETAPVTPPQTVGSPPAPQPAPEVTASSAVQAADPLSPAPPAEAAMDGTGNGQPQSVSPAETGPVSHPSPAPVVAVTSPVEFSAASAGMAAHTPPETSVAHSADISQAATTAAGPAVAPPAPTPVRPPRPRRSFSLAPLVGLLLAIVRPFAAAGRGVGRGLRSLLVRLLPGEGWVALSSQTLAFIAIAVPITVVAVATWVYRYKGVTAQAQVLYQEAAVAATAAEAETDPLQRRIALGDTLAALDRADAWYPLPESQDLRASIQKSLDALDLVKRVDFKPAIIGGLDAAVQVTRLVSADNDLYILDGRSGRVLRAFLTSGGYERDDSFQCGPAPAGQRAAPAAEGTPAAAAPAPIIDIAAWPPENTPEASLIALDKSGFVWYCAPGQPPQSEVLALPPSLMWEELVGFSLTLSHFHLLDPQQNAVWIYWNSIFDTSPELFFGTEVPPMQDVIDMAVNNDELYLLHADGHLTLCYYSAMTVAPTRCTDPTPYIDLRPGRENTPLTPPSPFSQILFNPPPDPSLYFLEPVNQAIYHFSLRNLAFQHQYVPAERLPGGPATAFAVSTLDRTFFMASGNGVYYARIP